jgi:drug/metabolite transporter (DMT)-like permease
VWLVLNERPVPATLAGGALILGALVVNAVLDLVRPRAAVS